MENRKITNPGKKNTNIRNKGKFTRPCADIPQGLLICLCPQGGLFDTEGEYCL